MRIRLMLLSFLSVLLLFGAVPETSEAKGKQKSGKVKSKKKSKRKGKSKDAESDTALDEDPYVDEAAEAPREAGEVPPAEEEEPVETEEETTGTKGGVMAAGEGSLHRSGRMEFDERLIKGQAAKSGAVYLFKRAPRRLPGLVPLRRSYRRRIVEPILGERELKPAMYSKGEEDLEKDKAADDKDTSLGKDPKETEEKRLQAEGTAKKTAEESAKNKDQDTEKTTKKTKKKSRRKKRGGKR
ncbi:MAG: hypothetical protein GY854_12830 [Deltaproteobacteria bacterium]|nr:hypothetical protein [Deltaproteobacteria bacterium]